MGTVTAVIILLFGLAFIAVGVGFIINEEGTHEINLLFMGAGIFLGVFALYSLPSP